jgi:hypothetical protein
MKSNTVLTVIFILVVAAVLIGEAYVYTLSPGRHSSDITIDDDGIEYSFTSKGSEKYSVVVLDNGAFEKIEKYYIYYDDSYGSKLEKVQVPVGAKELSQSYYISQLIITLNNRGIHNIEILNAGSLRDAMAGDADPGVPTEKAGSKGLIVLSGALPDTIYTGDKDDLIFNWINAGGSLYWEGNSLGKYFAEPGKVTEVTGDYESLFFGVSGCLNKNDENTLLSDETSNDYRHLLSMANNRIRYGLDKTKFNADDILAVGYTDGQYCSTAMVKFGSGMICVIAGDYSNNQRHDLAQIIASGISAYTEKTPAGYAEGEIKRGTVTGAIDIEYNGGHNYAAYVYYGGYYTVYGKMTGWAR